MAFKAVENILQPDPRFAYLCVVETGTARRMTLADHHGALADISLSGTAPTDVAAAFDRARNTIIYAFFDYDLFVVGEVQAFGAFELALKHRLNGSRRRGSRDAAQPCRQGEKGWHPTRAHAWSYSGLRPHRGFDRVTKWIVDMARPTFTRREWRLRS